MGTIFAEMSFRTAVTIHLGMKTTFWTKYIKSNMFALFLWWLQFYITLYKHYITVALKTNFMSSLLLCAVFLLICIFFNHSKKFKIFIIKIPKDSLFTFLVLNVVFNPLYHVKAVQDDISAKAVPIWLQHTVDGPW